MTSLQAHLLRNCYVMGLLLTYGMAGTWKSLSTYVLIHRIRYNEEIVERISRDHLVGRLLRFVQELLATDAVRSRRSACTVSTDTVKSDRWHIRQRCTRQSDRRNIRCEKRRPCQNNLCIFRQQTIARSMRNQDDSKRDAEANIIQPSQEFRRNFSYRDNL